MVKSKIVLPLVYMRHAVLPISSHVFSYHIGVKMHGKGNAFITSILYVALFRAMFYLHHVLFGLCSKSYPYAHGWV